MTLLEIQLTIQQIFQLLGKPLEMSLEQYNNYLRMAQDELFKEFAHGYITGNGVGVDMRTHAAINPFIHDDRLSSTSFDFHGIACNGYTHSSSVYYVLSVYNHNGTSTHPNQITKIDLLSSNEIVDRFQNAITYPTTSYPIGIWDQSALMIYVFPYSSWSSIHLRSLYRPTTPILIETITNGVRTQSNSSTPLQLDAMFHVDMIRKILQYLGVSIGNEFISTVVEQQKNLEK